MPPRVDGEGVYGGRDEIHAAISDDEGLTWRGFRTFYRDPFRNETPPKDGDRGTAYPQGTCTPDGRIVVLTGQGRGKRNAIEIDPNWLTSPLAPPAIGSMGPDPQNYFVAQQIVGGGNPRGGVYDTDPIGGGPGLSDATAVEFRLRPGETGTGMVAAIWRNDPGDMWSYDEDSPRSPPADTPEPPHPNGVQPVAARFFCSRRCPWR